MIVWVRFVFEGTSSVGCGLKLPRIAHLQNGALESANASHQSNFSALSANTARLYPYLKNRVECDAAAGCLALRIRKMGPSNRRMRVAGPKVPAFSAITGKVGP